MTPAQQICANATDCNLPNTSLTSSTVYTVLGNVFIGVGILAVVFLVVGGLRYAISGGDPNNTKKAKETIIYSIIGLIIALLAFTIVYLVSHVAGTGKIS